MKISCQLELLLEPCSAQLQRLTGRGSVLSDEVRQMVDMLSLLLVCYILPPYQEFSSSWMKDAAPPAGIQGRWPGSKAKPFYLTVSEDYG